MLNCIRDWVYATLVAGLALSAGGCAYHRDATTAWSTNSSPLRASIERYAAAQTYEDRGVAFVWSSSENEDGLYPDTIQFATRYDRTTGQLRLEYWRENQMNAAQPHGVVVMDDNEDFNGREIDRQSDIYAQAGVSAGVSVLVPLLVHGINPWRGCPAPSGVYDAAREQVGNVDTTRTIVQVSPCASVVVWIDEQRTIRKIAERSVVDARTARQYLIDLRSRRPDLSADIDRRIAATTSSLVIETTVIFDARLDVPLHP